MLKQLWNDEAGFIISAELVLVCTLLVIGLIVGLSEVQHAVVTELNDCAEAIGCLNQSYLFTGFIKKKTHGNGGGKGIAAFTAGSFKFDRVDECDNNECDLDCLPPKMEGPKCDGN